MLLYLRHGDDRGEDTYRHDRPLNEKGQRQSAKEACYLVEKHDRPDLVYVSPFRRALETLECMTTGFDRPVEIRRDHRIAQHLSDKQQRNPSVSPETRALVDIDEDRDAFRLRVLDHIREVRSRLAKAPSLNIWAITHQGVVEEIARQLGVKIAGDLDFLDYVIMIR